MVNVNSVIVLLASVLRSAVTVQLETPTPAPVMATNGGTIGAGSSGGNTSNLPWNRNRSNAGSGYLGRSLL